MRIISTYKTRAKTHGRRKPAVPKALRVFLTAAAVIFIILLLFDKKVRPVVETSAKYQSGNYASRVIENAVLNELSKSDEYQNLVYLRYTDGHVSSVESDMLKINRLKARVSQSVNEELADIKNYKLGVSLGTASGIRIFYGRGPTLSLLLTTRGYAQTHFISRFESAGINQTLHKVLLTVDVSISATLAGLSVPITVPSEYIVSETLIVGVVPNSYANIELG